MHVCAQDEYLHHPPSSQDPLWVESYAFNGYDPVSELGIVIYVGIKPSLRTKLETVALYSRNPLFLQNLEYFRKEDVFESGCVKIEPLLPLKKWRIQVNDSFHKTKNGCLSNGTKRANLDLYFDSVTPLYRFSTNRGNRYEQPGFLRGQVRIGEDVVDFEGRGIRDHSWEIRNVPAWGTFYWLMGCFESGEAVSFTFMNVGSDSLCHGWLKTDVYHEIRSIEINPKVHRDILRKCQAIIKTDERELELNLQILSFLSIPSELIFFASLPTEQKESKIVENLVELNEGKGHGFMWHGR